MQTTRPMSDVSRMPTGFPPLHPLERAKQIAAAARYRNAQVCTCHHCQQKEKLAAVQNILTNWSK